MELVLNTDYHLVQRACNGERNGFEEIVEVNKKKIFYLAYDLTGSMQDAEDLSQEVFLKAYRSLKTYKGDASLGTWLYRITLNAFLDRKRKLSYRYEKETRPVEDYESSMTPTHGESASETLCMSPLDYAQSEQIQADIETAMTDLTPRERAVFIMRHYQGMPGKEVGRILNISDGTVKTLLFRGIKKLQKQLMVYNTDVPHPSTGVKEVYR